MLNLLYYIECIELNCTTIHDSLRYSILHYWEPCVLYVLGSEKGNFLRSARKSCWKITSARLENPNSTVEVSSTIQLYPHAQKSVQRHRM